MGEALKRRLRQDRFESPTQEALLNLIVAAGFVRDRIDRALATHGITHGQYNVLRILRGAYPNGYPRCDVAERMLERAPDVTRLIDRLEDRGFVERDRSGTDRRLSITRITAPGLSLLERIDPDIRAVHEFFSQRVQARDCLELSRICEGIYDDGR